MSLHLTQQLLLSVPDVIILTELLVSSRITVITELQSLKETDRWLYIIAFDTVPTGWLDVALFSDPLKMLALGQTVALMVLAAIFLCSGNICIIASKVDGLVPYSSITVTFLIEVIKLTSMLVAILVTNTTAPDSSQLRKSLYYAVPAVLNALESNLNYVVLRYLDAATLSVLWNLKILLTAVLFRYVLKHPLSELHKLAIALLILGVLTSQSDHFRRTESNSSDDARNLILGLSLALVGVTLSSCASVFAEWILKRQSNCPFLWQGVLMYGYGVLFNALGLIVIDGKLLLSRGFFHGYSIWTVIVVIVNSISGIFMACILKYLDNIACVYSHSMAMMFTTLLSMIFFAFSPSLEFVCGIGTLVSSMYLYHHPLAQVITEKDTSSISYTDDESPSKSVASLQLRKPNEYEEVPNNPKNHLEKSDSCSVSVVEA